VRVLSFLLLLEVVLYGSVQSVQQGERGTKIEASLLHKNRGSFGGFFLLAGGRTDVVRTTTVAHFSRCCSVGGSYNSTGFGTFSKAEIVGTVLGVVSGFLAGNVFCC
jgi:hypothetical protein